MEFTCSNYSKDSITPLLWLINPYFGAATLTMGTFLIVFMLIGIPWNLLLIVLIVKKRLFEQPAILLLLNLAVTNLLLCVAAMPLMIIPAIAGEFIFGQSDYARCQVCHLTIIMSTLFLMSVHNVALLSLDRFLYVKKPLQYDTIVTLKRVAAILVLCWVIFSAYSILPVFGIGKVTFAEVLPACVLTWEVRGINMHYIYYWVYIVSACLVPVAILVITNIWMLCIMRKSLRNGYVRARRNSIGGDKALASQIRGRYTKNQTRLSQIFVTLLVSSFVTWLPIVIVIILVTAAQLFVLELTTFAFLCLLSQPVIHPILQVLLHRDMREVVARPFRGCQRTSNENLQPCDDQKTKISNSFNLKPPPAIVSKTIVC